MNSNVNRSFWGRYKDTSSYIALPSLACKCCRRFFSYKLVSCKYYPFYHSHNLSIFWCLQIITSQPRKFPYKSCINRLCICTNLFVRRIAWDVQENPCKILDYGCRQNVYSLLWHKNCQKVFLLKEIDDFMKETLWKLSRHITAPSSYDDEYLLKGPVFLS